MIARIQKSMEEKDQGFTLIELLVVMIIIGILAAIAIPVFLNQRKKAVDSSIKSDLRTVANAMETYYTDEQAYPATFAIAAAANPAPADVGSADNQVTLSKNNAINVTTDATGAGSFCIVGSNTAATQAWVYKSAAGGLQDKSVTTCP